jgi:hypothetical protein
MTIRNESETRGAVVHIDPTFGVPTTLFMFSTASKEDTSAMYFRNCGSEMCDLLNFCHNDSASAYSNTIQKDEITSGICGMFVFSTCQFKSQYF